jgi:hypothetical protein
LIGTLVVVVLGSFVYVIWMSLRAGDMTLELLISVMQTIGTTLLAPIVGLIGAVVGFYFGAQTAVQGAQAANQSTRTATQATEAVTGSFEARPFFMPLFTEVRGIGILRSS